MWRSCSLLQSYWIWGYAIFAGCIVVIALVRSLMFFAASLHATTAIHDAMIERVRGGGRGGLLTAHLSLLNLGSCFCFSLYFSSWLEWRFLLNGHADLLAFGTLNHVGWTNLVSS